MNSGRSLAGVAGAALLVTSCGGAEPETMPGPDAGTVTVLAAASLTESFEKLGQQLAAEHPGLDLMFSFGPSSGLVEQVLAGAQADLLATADARTMDVAVAGGAIAGEPEVFARNTLTLIVPAGNPGGVTGLAHLARPELRVAICEPRVPCGAASERLLAAAGVAAAPDTLAADVKAATSLVALGEADAALVYRTDALAEGDAVEIIETPEAAEIVNEFVVAVLADAPNPAGAHLVVNAITGDLGQGILTDAGFLASP